MGAAADYRLSSSVRPIDLSVPASEAADIVAVLVAGVLASRELLRAGESGGWEAAVRVAGRELDRVLNAAESLGLAVEWEASA